MILSNRRIHEALDRGWIAIDPQSSPRFVAEGQACPYQTSSVDLRLGTEIAWLRDGLPISVDLGRGGFADLFEPNSESTTLTADQPYVLKHGKFVLGKTLEAENGKMTSTTEVTSVERKRRPDNKLRKFP